MQVFHGLDEYQAGHHPMVTIGTFDGVHLGHRTILDRLIADAKAVQGESVLVTFHPHPRLVLFPENNTLQLLQTLAEKIATLEQLGLDKLVIIPFTRDFSRMPSERFIQDILAKTICAHKIVIGYDHRFGRNRRGGLEELRSYAPSLGYAVEEIPAQAIDDANVSSTKVRNALSVGDVDLANRYLGYPYTMGGEVVDGAKDGRKFGYPTANIQLENDYKLTPAHGVYLVRAWLEQEDGGGHPDQRLGPYMHGLMSIGTKGNPAADAPVFHEVFLYDFAGNIYGLILRVAFLAYLRPQIDFKGDMDALITAMKNDDQRGRSLLARYPHPTV